MKAKRLAIQTASIDDRQQLANLIHFGVHVHRHLDWRPPLDWVGHRPFLVGFEDGEMLAALACPPDPPNVAWIRVFAAAESGMLDYLWSALWEASLVQLKDLHDPIRVAAISMQGWFKSLLESSGFSCIHRVVVLAWEKTELPPAPPISSLVIRPMLFGDIPQVEKVDAAAFEGVWNNSRSCLELAYNQSAVATVAEKDGQLVGYQISTATQMGGHLARLAVFPEYQGHGIGYALLHDLLFQFQQRGARAVTVNTQHDNYASLSIYRRAGFHLTGEEYPVYGCEIG